MPRRGPKFPKVRNSQERRGDATTSGMTDTSLRVEILDKMGALITAAFGLVAALAWNDAIQAVFRQVFGDQSAIPAKLAYASLVTILAVVLVIYVGKAASRAKSGLAPVQR
jgi:uncharacterized membrane protein YidH (DUF202 family)